MRVRWVPVALLCWLCGTCASPLSRHNINPSSTYHTYEPIGRAYLHVDESDCACAAPCSCQCTLDSAGVRADCRAVGLTSAIFLDLSRSLHLQMLDLRDNKIARMDASWVFTILRDTRTRMRLAGNPLVCDCVAKQLLTLLRKRQAQVEDYVNVTCADGVRVGDVDQSTLCSVSDGSEVWVALTVVMAALLVLMALVVAFRRYRDRIKKFLFGKGWCLCYVLDREPPSEEARSHDVFVSFGEHDEPLVAEHLLPRLEQEYRACWYPHTHAPGPLDISRLTELVQNSRRMIIVVSRIFLLSTRNMMEFRTAYTSALSAGNMRIVVVCLDDTAVDDFPDPDLRFVLKTNLCLQWSDPKLWTKLRYEMPHYPHGPHPSNQ